MVTIIHLAPRRASGPRPGGPVVVPTRHSGGALRHAAALALRSASSLLARIAARLAEEAAPRSRAAPELEFADGVLYSDGRYVGHVAGVRRL
ncbi:hypothetical protein [Rivibacter subsaxonicus]|uniref:Uncharacterized protein n=1 Tax=Rivibacter subsaxonicus TaxID=457575 RepID=A0A4Q7VYY6_9BURK|nr:hypothetical protein [Rivibacter subsaxonicus]RZU02004.1 hypothetical protein EV670_0022 [Rivibacter subsaxonicus]